ncbi:hypothetical protein [Sphingomonas sp.]|uniref:hypothetical protein n=1 Tax=Sphingomonas sp. TaxID=28214 RepID=UPI0031DBF6E4
MTGATFGAGLAAMADAHAPHTVGPVAVIVFGAELPIWSIIFGIIGVLMARRVAPATAAGTALGRTGNTALTVLLVLGVLALIVSGEKRPIVALGWSIGLGFSGLGMIEMVARAVRGGARLILDGFVVAATKGAAMWADRRENGQ